MAEQFRFTFEDLRVWKDAVSFAKDVYALTEAFPKDERFGLTSQLRRAAVSVSSNIVEGSAKTSLKDQNRFTEIAIGSLLESLNQIILAYKLQFIKESFLLDLRQKIESLYRQLNALRLSQKNRNEALTLNP